MKTKKIIVDWKAEREKKEAIDKNTRQCNLMIDAYYNEFLKMIESIYDEKGPYTKKEFIYSILSIFITKTVATENVNSN